MRPSILIVGQGLAGSLLGWALERAGIRFAIADQGHGTAATDVAAGIINPITGRRLVKSWHVERLLPDAREVYREIGDTLGVALWHPMRVRRYFADERERTTFAAKRGSGELAPFAGEWDHDGFWIEDAARVDLRGLLAALRARWLKQGVLHTTKTDPLAAIGQHAWVIDCSGVEGARLSEFDFVPWEFSKGEVLELQVEGLAPNVILNRRQWVVPVGPHLAWVGATHEPGVVDRMPSPRGRASLERAAMALLPQGFTVTRSFAGIRVNLPDKLPVAGPHPTSTTLGIINGLGAKGALFAPLLAQTWVRHVQRGEAFAPEISVARFIRPGFNPTQLASP